jgi:hypothetical protein
MEAQQAEFEINYIKKLMEDSRRSLAENGIGYIIWGVLVVIGISFNYLRLLDYTSINPMYVWIGVIGLGWTVTIISIRKEKKTIKARTMADKVLGAVWFSAGISMTMIGFPGTISGMVSGYAILPLISIILGIAYFVSGTVYGEKWIQFIGFGWWITAIIFLYWRSIHSLAIFAVLMILFQVMPGIYFYKKWKEYKANNRGIN